jgi:hypothetical protein
LVNGSCCGTTFGDGPHDEALASTHVSGNEHAVDVCGPALVSCDVSSDVELDTELLEHSTGLRSYESHGEKHELTFELELRTFDRNE